MEKRKSDTLSPQLNGPYKVIAKVGSLAYTLRLPEGSRVHPTFHVSLLKKCLDPSITPVHPLEDFTEGVVVRELALTLDRMMVRRKDRTITKVLVQ